MKWLYGDVMRAIANLKRQTRGGGDISTAAAGGVTDSTISAS